MTGAFDEKDTVTWYVNGKSTGSQDIPKQLAVGEYTVKLVVQRDNYNDFEKTVTAKISNAKINLGDLKVTGLDGVYNGKAQEQSKLKIREITHYIISWMMEVRLQIQMLGIQQFLQ